MPEQPQSSSQFEPVQRLRFGGATYELAAKWPERLALGVVSRDDVLAAIDKIEREEYIEGGRCGDFKLALDAVRKALRS